MFPAWLYDHGQVVPISQSLTTVSVNGGGGDKDSAFARGVIRMRCDHAF